ncbi:hypothetical protein SDC9_164737 [bioreactor metagenome]|uniref:Uncharacterized protein n=1 Tax=bioreactor metagenome TaxID=1076179 RepID=A0A645FZU2_9ZZZZ
MINGKVISRFRLHVEITEINNGSFSYLKLYIPVTCFSFARVNVCLFKVDAGFVGRWYDKTTHHKSENGNDGCRYHIGPEQPFKAYPVG